ncbi:hypothetical protein GCM10009839_58160 [Catenulispora yoronensis]|uniref:Uncharacterized protein n=1 Tax=Catenulispora yoronensis TaxID=450799 RepID=A0ABP5GGV0_9ACTN
MSAGADTDIGAAPGGGGGGIDGANGADDATGAPLKLLGRFTRRSDSNRSC